MKTKTGLLKDIQNNVIDTCVVCGSEFANPGNSPDMVYLCSRECSQEIQRHPEVIKKLYKEQFLKREVNQKTDEFTEEVKKHEENKNEKTKTKNVFKKSQNATNESPRT
jgi:uncharacterized membrane-anchored protein YjiN (DUF445 family)